jgi:hypothetical protein
MCVALRLSSVFLIPVSGAFAQYGCGVQLVVTNRVSGVSGDAPTSDTGVDPVLSPGAARFSTSTYPVSRRLAS